MHRRHKKPYAVIFVVVVALVVFGALRDIELTNNPPPPERTATRMHYADDAHDFEKLPRDTSPVLVRTGTAEQQANGHYTFTPSDIAPITLPQREVILAFSLKGDLPPSYIDFAGMLQKTLNTWKRKNNKITEIMLEWQGDTADIQKMVTLANDIYMHMKTDYWIGYGLQRKWFEADPAQAALLATRQQGIRDYVFDIHEASREGETLPDTLAALNSYGIPFMLRTDQAPDEKEALALMDAHDKFLGFVVVR